MGRPSLTNQKRVEFQPIIAKAFVELGFRRSTTAELAKRCGVQENVLYRIWPSKKAMFLASIEYIFEVVSEKWGKLLARAAEEGVESPAELLLEQEAGSRGEWRLYRIIFAGLNETDDEDIKAALQGMYSRFQAFLAEQIAAHRKAKHGDQSKWTLDATLTSWAIIGLATASDIAQELELLKPEERRSMISQAGEMLLNQQ